MRSLDKLILLTTICILHSPLSMNAQDGKLTGIVMGTETCYDYDTKAVTTTKNTPSNAFDGDLTTFVATYDESHTWVGLDLGTPHVITQVGWSPCDSKSGPKLVQLGLFEGSNREDFMDAIPLYMITEQGVVGAFSSADVKVSRGFRYVRWCGPAGSRCNVAEIEFYGHEGAGDDSQFYQLTNLPTLSYHTYCGKEPWDKTTELESEMCIVYDDGKRIQEYPILARERGNGSRHEAFLKRPYRIKFNDGKSHHMLKDSPLESPSKSKKWTLLPNWREKSLIRNNIAFEMSRRLGSAYTPWIQNVDVIVNGEYKGNYQLADQVTVGMNRVHITEMTTDDNEEPDITGGYLLEITSPGETYHFSSNRGIPVDVKYPDDNDLTTLQFTYIRQAFNAMEASLWAANYKDAERGYRTKLDLESFLRHILVGEFAGNTDAMWSVYLYKERGDDHFHFGPVWDFDLSMDNDQRVYPANGKSDWLFNYGSAVSGIKDFVRRVLSDPYALATLSSIWSGMRKSGAFSPQSLCAYVDSLATVMDQSQRLNFTRWDNLGQRLTLQQFAPGTYQGEIDIVKNYLTTRIAWIDDMLGYEDIPDLNPSDMFYVIHTAREFQIFEHAVNTQGLTTLNARLDADIDLSVLSARLKPIGTAEQPYAGTFDGQNHIISGLTFEKENDNVGLFGSLTAGACVRGITLDSSCTIRGANGVGLVGSVQGEGVVTLECLGNEGSVEASGKWAGGILGTCADDATSVLIRYCYASGSIQGGQESAAIGGWLGQKAQVVGCYNIASVSGVSDDMSFARHEGASFTRCFNKHNQQQTGVTKLSDSSVTRGELCYRLHDHSGSDETPRFFQTLNEDEHPVLQRHLEVIRQGASYVNKTDFDIASAQDLIDFASLVNSGLTDINATVNSDIDFEGCTVVPIGTSENPYTGTFDGQGHVFSHLEITSSKNYTGLFSFIGPDAHIQNFVLDSTCSIIGGSYTAIVGGTAKASGNVYLIGLGNEGYVKGNQNTGAIFGCAMNNAASVCVDRCYSTGTIVGSHESGALTGYIGKGYIRNSWSCATIEGYYATASKPFALCYCETKNNYVVHWDLNPNFDIKQTTAEQVASGELCYLLNENSGQQEPLWYQTLDQDAHPVLDSTHGEVKRSDDGSYYNEGNHIQIAGFSPSGSESYSLSGLRVNKTQPGIHIIRTRDGKTYKVYVR